MKIIGGLPGRWLNQKPDCAALEMLSQGKRWEDPGLLGGCCRLELGAREGAGSGNPGEAGVRMEGGGLGAVAEQREVSSMGGAAQRGPAAGRGGGGESLQQRGREMDGLVPVSPPNTLICPVGPSHLQAHVVREAGEEVMLHVAADERVAEGPVEQDVAGQVEDAQAHEVDPLGFPIGREHGEANVLRERQGGHPAAPTTPAAEPTVASGHARARRCWPG